MNFKKYLLIGGVLLAYSNSVFAMTTSEELSSYVTDSDSYVIDSDSSEDESFDLREGLKELRDEERTCLKKAKADLLKKLECEIKNIRKINISSFRDDKKFNYCCRAIKRSILLFKHSLTLNVSSYSTRVEIDKDKKSLGKLCLDLFSFIIKINESYAKNAVEEQKDLIEDLMNDFLNGDLLMQVYGLQLLYCLLKVDQSYYTNFFTKKLIEEKSFFKLFLISRGINLTSERKKINLICSRFYRAVMLFEVLDESVFSEYCDFARKGLDFWGEKLEEKGAVDFDERKNRREKLEYILGRVEL